MKSNREVAEEALKPFSSVFSAYEQRTITEKLTAALDTAVKQTWEDAADIAQKDLFAEHTERLAQRFRIKASQVGNERGGV